MFKLIIFDLDGVIIDSEKTIVKSYLNACNDILWPWNFPSVEEFLSHTWESLAEILRKLNILEIKDKYLEYAFQYQNEIGIFTDVVDLIIELYNSKKLIALVTWKGRDRTEQILKKFWLEKYFNLIITSSDVKKSKPDPEWILKVISDLGASKKDSVYIWDSTNDIVASQNAWIKVIAVTWGMHDEFTLKFFDPDYIVHKAQEIKNII